MLELEGSLKGRLAWSKNNRIGRHWHITGNTLRKLPENLQRLHSGEEFLRAQSVAKIESDTALSRHVAAIEIAMDLLNIFSAVPRASESEDIKTVRLLGIRLFNGCAGAFQLSMSGYYQLSTMVMRDLLETIFLLGFFQIDQTKISTWRNCDEQSRIKNFSPAKVRIALDEMSGFKEKRREAAYKLLCELGSHPTHKGFAMLAPTGQGHHCGPFFDPNSLKAMIEELVKLANQAGQVFSPFFDEGLSVAEYETKISFLEISLDWMKDYMNIHIDKTPLEEAKTELKLLKAHNMRDHTTR